MQTALDSPSPVSLRETVLSPGGRGENVAPFPSPLRGEDVSRSETGEGESVRKAAIP